MDIDATPERDTDDQTTLPLTRYNAMIAIVKNTLYLFVPRDYCRLRSQR
jgi:hypothetical protein